jgi:DNA-binding FadR family transcriptional regulator
VAASRYEDIAEQIRNEILNGARAVGERLPVESTLAGDFGVSRSTIREALRVLGSEGLIETTRGVSGGSFVVKAGPEKVSEYLESSLGVLSDQETISAAELLQTRELLEATAAGLAAERRTSAHLSAMRDSLEQELEFHTALLAAAQNRLLEVIAVPVLRLVCSRLPEAEGARSGSLDGDHQRILERIEAGDPEGAAAATAEHLGRLAATR